MNIAVISFPLICNSAAYLSKNLGAPRNRASPGIFGAGKADYFGTKEDQSQAPARARGDCIPSSGDDASALLEAAGRLDNRLKANSASDVRVADGSKNWPKLATGSDRSLAGKPS